MHPVSHGVETDAPTYQIHVMPKMEAADSPLSPTQVEGPKSHNKRHSTHTVDDSVTRKRQKLSPSATSPTDHQPSRKGRACVACRKLKVKCDAWERGLAGCSRCQRLGIECINARRLRIAVEGEDGGTHPTIRKIERALEDVLQKLEMPSLETYANDGESDMPLPPKQPASEFQTTRENSKEPAEEEKALAPAPMGSLFEATQLNSLRTRLRRVNPRKRTAKRRMEADMVSQNLLSMEHAEELLDLFKCSLSRYLFNTTIPEDVTLTNIRESSSILFTAIMLVSALHIPGREAVHAICHKQFLELVSTAMFDRFHTLDDIRGLCIAAFWQPDLSWKLSGLCIRMATELNLHHAFYKVFYTNNLSENERSGYLEKARVWYLLYVLDHHFSIAYGRPPVTAELLPITQNYLFVEKPFTTPSDRRLISQVSLFVILSKAYEVFGLEPDRVMVSDDLAILQHTRFTDQTRGWRDHWRDLLLEDKFVGDYPSKGVLLHHGFSELVLNSLALRGRPLENLASLPNNLRPLAAKAIDAAHFILRYTMEEPAYRESLVGIPLYLHSMIAFAAVFLMRIAHKWHSIGVELDPETHTKPLIEAMIRTLRACKAGNNHMVYSMANGFERLLKQWGKNATNGSAHRSLLPRPEGLQRTDSGTVLTPSMHSSPEYAIGQTFDPTITSDAYEYPLSAMSGYSNSGWGQDDMLWSVGGGYDLLAPNGTGYDMADYSSSFYPLHQQ